MDGIRHRERFAEIEALMDSYFRCHIAPVMSKTRTYLTEKQGEEMMEYSTSPGGILSLMASSMQPLADPYQVLKATGEWNSKTTEDYIEMCKAEIAGSEAMQQDLAYMAERWREAVVQEVGRERYDELSRELGCDLAYAFVDYRVEQLMIGRLVEERMPRSSSEYIIRKAAESSLLGLTQTLSRSPLAEEIERRGEAAYRPSKIEKGAAKVLGVSADAVMLGGAGSWTALARFVGMDAAVSAVASRLWPEGPEPLSAELCISKGVFGPCRTCEAPRSANARSDTGTCRWWSPPGRRKPTCRTKPDAKPRRTESSTGKPEGKRKCGKKGQERKKGKRRKKTTRFGKERPFPGSRRGKSATERRPYRRRATRTDGKACSARWGWTAWAM